MARPKIALSNPPEKSAYMTTAAAGWFVARKRMPGVYGQAAVNGKTTPTHEPKAGHVLWLSALAAEYELRQGAIVLMNPQPASTSAADVQAAAAEQHA